MDACRFSPGAPDHRAPIAAHGSLAAVFLAAVMLAGISGCQTAWRSGAGNDALADASAADGASSTASTKAPPADAGGKAAAPTTPPASANGPGNPQSPAANAASAAAGSWALADGRWVQSVMSVEGPPSKYRWRHFGLEAWLARGSWQAELNAALADPQPIVARLAEYCQGHPDEAKQLLAMGDPQAIVTTNAAIVLARDGSEDAAVVSRLSKSIDDVTLRLPLRYASVEALAQVPTESAHGELGRLVDLQAKFWKETPSAYTPDMHAELLMALIASAGPGKLADDNPRLVAALSSPAAPVRRVALAAWLDRGRTELPQKLIDLRHDPDPKVRATALEVLAVQKPKPAESLLLASLDDTDLSVRAAAIGALGTLGTPAARTALEKLRTHSHEAARVAAVHALAKMAGYQAVLVSAKDKSWRVRQAVAESLGLARQDGQPIAGEAIELATSMVHDPSLEVQRHLLKSLSAWPLESSGGVLLTAMAEGGYQTRKDATALLAKQWPAAADFPVEAPAAERAPAMLALQSRWRSQRPAQAAMASSDSAPASLDLPAEKLARLEQLVFLLGDARTSPEVRQQAVDALVGFGPTLPAALESPVFVEQGELPAAVYREVLPKVSPVFAALDTLNARDVTLRRGAALQLANALGGKPMPRLALDRLASLCKLENDPVVWQSVLQTTAHDARQGAEQLAYLAVGNASSDVRRRACDYLAAHPDRRHVAILMPMLADPSSTVAIAAVRGLGAIGSLDDPRPLIDLLLTNDRPLRLEVATNLVKLKVDGGRAALQRMAMDPDNQMRLDVAQRMGELGEQGFLPTLLELAAERSDVSRVALESLTKLTGQDFSRDSEGSLVSRDAQLTLWQNWYRRQQLAEKTEVPNAPPAGVVPATYAPPIK